MNSIIVFLLAVGVAVADVSELSKSYLPPVLVENAVLSEFAVTEGPATEAPTTTVVEIEMVPLEEKHEVELPAAPEQPIVPSIYEQPPVLLYAAPIVDAQTEAPAAVEGEEEGSAVAPEELPVLNDIIIVEEIPEEKEAPAATEEAPVVTESSATEAAAVTEESAITEEEAPASEESAAAVETTSAASVVEEDEAPVVKEAVEVPAVEAEPEPAHVLAEDGYRYKTASRFRYRF